MMTLAFPSYWIHSVLFRSYLPRHLSVCHSAILKPKASYAEEFLGVKCKDGDRKYMSVFGQYILTPEVFDQLRSDIANATDSNKEIELTSALDKVREQTGMIGIQLQGRMFDMGNPLAYKNCIIEFDL